MRPSGLPFPPSVYSSAISLCLRIPRAILITVLVVDVRPTRASLRRSAENGKDWRRRMPESPEPFESQRQRDVAHAVAHEAAGETTAGAVPGEIVITDDLGLLLDTLPPRVRLAIQQQGIENLL